MQNELTSPFPCGGCIQPAEGEAGPIDRGVELVPLVAPLESPTGERGVSLDVHLPARQQPPVRLCVQTAVKGRFRRQEGTQKRQVQVRQQKRDLAPVGKREPRGAVGTETETGGASPLFQREIDGGVDAASPAVQRRLEPVEGYPFPFLCEGSRGLGPRGDGESPRRSKGELQVPGALPGHLPPGEPRVGAGEVQALPYADELAGMVPAHASGELDALARGAV